MQLMLTNALTLKKIIYPRNYAHRLRLICFAVVWYQFILPFSLGLHQLYWGCKHNYRSGVHGWEPQLLGPTIIAMPVKQPRRIKWNSKIRQEFLKKAYKITGKQGRIELWQIYSLKHESCPYTKLVVAGGEVIITLQQRTKMWICYLVSFKNNPVCKVWWTNSLFRTLDSAHN